MTTESAEFELLSAGTAIRERAWDKFVSNLRYVVANERTDSDAMARARETVANLKNELDDSFVKGVLTRDAACFWALRCIESDVSLLTYMGASFSFKHSLMSLSFEEIRTRLIVDMQLERVDDCHATDAELKDKATTSPDPVARALASCMLHQKNESRRSEYQTKLYRNLLVSLCLLLAPKRLPALSCERIARYTFGRQRTQLVPFHVTFGIAHNVQQSWKNRRAARNLPDKE